MYRARIMATSYNFSFLGRENVSRSEIDDEKKQWSWFPKLRFSLSALQSADDSAVFASSGVG